MLTLGFCMIKKGAQLKYSTEEQSYNTWHSPIYTWYAHHDGIVLKD